MNDDTRPRQRKHANPVGMPHRGRRIERIKALMKEAGGTGSWGMNVMRGCTCRGTELDPCDVCVAVAKTGRMAQPEAAPAAKPPEQDADHTQLALEAIRMGYELVRAGEQVLLGRDNGDAELELKTALRQAGDRIYGLV
jgi:hypothetical protein